MRISSLWSRPPPRTSTMLSGRPEPRPGRAGLAIVAIMRDEAHHIEDWLKFHAFAGVRDFYLYDDASKDGSSEIAKAFPGPNVTVLPWRMTASLLNPKVFFSRQVLAYCHAIENFGGAYRWMAFIDIDEYIVPKGGDTILEVLNGLEAFTNVSLPWTMFGPSGHDTRPEIPAAFAYTQRAAHRQKPILNFKCIVDPLDVVEVRVHRFRTRFMGKKSVNDVGYMAYYKDREKETFLSDSALQLNHYYTRSRSDLEAKLTKGAVSASPIDRRNNEVLEKVAIIENTAVEDRCAIEFLAKNGVGNPEAFRSAQLPSFDTKSIGELGITTRST